MDHQDKDVSSPKELSGSSSTTLSSRSASSASLAATSFPSRPAAAFVKGDLSRRASSNASSHDDLRGATACPTPAESQSAYVSRQSSLMPIKLSPDFLNKTASVKATEFASDYTTFSTTYNWQVYAVEKVGEQDDSDRWPAWKRSLHAFAPYVTVAAVVAYWNYFVHRILYTVDAQRTYHRTFVMAWLFIVAEFLVGTPAMFHQMWQLTAIRGRKRPKLRLRGEFVPTVNVLITSCKEDIDIVLDTTRAACSQDYPTDRYRVTVCDDGADPDLKRACEDLKLQFPNLSYHARVKVKGKPHHFKAGNLIAATNFVAGLEGGSGEFIAALDADMIPDPEWLRAILAHQVIDPQMALSCPPQLFYNIPDDDPLVQSLDGFVHVMEPVKDASGVAWCTGSGYAIRVAALEDIGGWPVGSLAEDTFTSSKLLGHGWKTAYLHEALQWGTVPDDLPSHLKQRTRWTLGTLQTAVKLRFCLYGQTVSRMTFLQRVSGFVFTIDAFFKIFLVVSLLTVPIVLMSGGTLVAYANMEQLRWQARFCFIALIAQRLNEFVSSLPSGYRQTQREAASMIWMAPYHAITVFRSFILPKWLGGKAMAFSSSGSHTSMLNERDAKLRAPLFRRLKVILWDCKAYMHLLYLMFCLAAVIISVTRTFTQHHDTHSILLSLLTHVGWPPLLWMIAMVACSTPIMYAIWPPTMPDREELLERDPKTGVAYPKPERKKQIWSKTHWLHEFQYSLITAFTTFIFFVSIFYV